MTETSFYNKSGLLNSAANVLDSNGLYPAVAHSAYYSCFLLMSHIWIDRMDKTTDELDSLCATLGKGKHDVLIDKVYQEISASASRSSFKDSRDFNNKIKQLKRLRVIADYKNEPFLKDHSMASITLMKEVTLILKRYI